MVHLPDQRPFHRGMLVACDGGGVGPLSCRPGWQNHDGGFKVVVVPSLAFIQNLQLDMHNICEWLLHCNEE
jgi:hypothetical protein